MLETKSLARSHGGIQGVYTHQSEACGCPMTFAVFVPPHKPGTKLPVLWYLSGLTCTHANVMEKGEYRKTAAEHAGQRVQVNGGHDFVTRGCRS